MESVSALIGGLAALQRPAAPTPPVSGPAGEPAVSSPEAAVSPPSEADTEYLNSLLQQHQQHLAFSVDDASGHAVIKVIDTASGDVIRQMPSVSWLKLAQELARQAGGLLRTQA